MKITVAIPTAVGRLGYLQKCLESCVAQPEAAFEIVVSDNSGGAARELVARYNDPRIRYVAPPGYLAMAPHWDFVLQHVTGDLVTFLGDDDAVMPGCIAHVQDLIGEYGLRPLRHSLACYFWPDFPESRLANTVVYYNSIGDDSSLVSPRDFLSSIAKGLGRYVDGPMVYHNFVPTDLLRKLARGGAFFRRASPDVYSAMAVALNVTDYISTSRLLTLFGQGRKANGAGVRLNRPDSDQFMKDLAALFPQRYNSRTIQLCLLDSFQEALDVFEIPPTAYPVDMPAHLVRAFAESRQINGVNNRLREVGTILAAAARNGCLVPVLRRILAAGARRMGLGSGGAARAGTSPAATNEPLRLPAEVTDVHQAAMHLDRFLSEGPSSEAALAKCE